MKQQRRTSSVARTFAVAIAALGFVAFGLSARAVQPNDVAPVSHDMRRLGHADLHGRTAYQPTLHTINGRVYLFVGHFGGTTPSGLVNGGTTIVDVTDPANPKEVSFTPSSGSQMVRVCDGGVIGSAGSYYMLRNTSNTHEVWDVTNPASPALLSVIRPDPSNPSSVFTATHKNWWECDTGIAYIVAGQSGAGGDGWKTNQHIKIYDLRIPSSLIFAISGWSVRIPVRRLPPRPPAYTGRFR